jgi:hypothetical protein
VLKTFNPKLTFTYEVDDTVFEYRAYAGPLIPTSSDPDEAMRYVVKQYLNHCIVSVTNIELPITAKDGSVSMVEYAKWEGSPKVDWSQILPTAIQNSLWVKISQATNLSATESRDLS